MIFALKLYSGDTRFRPRLERLYIPTELFEAFLSSSLQDKLSYRRILQDRLCGVVVTLPGYTFRGPEFDFRRYVSET
jgi:hypothetical protein